MTQDQWLAALIPTITILSNTVATHLLKVREIKVANDLSKSQAFEATANLPFGVKLLSWIGSPWTLPPLTILYFAVRLHHLHANLGSLNKNDFFDVSFSTAGLLLAVILMLMGYGQDKIYDSMRKQRLLIVRLIENHNQMQRILALLVKDEEA